MAVSGLGLESAGEGVGRGLDDPEAATLSSSSSASRWAKASSLSILGWVGYRYGDDTLLGGRDAER